MYHYESQKPPLPHQITHSPFILQGFGEQLFITSVGCFFCLLLFTLMRVSRGCLTEYISKQSCTGNRFSLLYIHKSVVFSWCLLFTNNDDNAANQSKIMQQNHKNKAKVSLQINSTVNPVLNYSSRDKLVDGRFDHAV